MKKIILFLLIISHINGISQDNQPKIDLEKQVEDLAKQKSDTISPWKKGGVITISGQQVSLTNWSAGGQSAISANTLINLFASYVKDKNSWVSQLDIAYGVIKQGDNKTWWKNDDRIQLTSKYGRKGYKNMFYTALLDFRSQLAEGYNYPNDSVKISNFLAPAYIISALGADIKPNPNFSLLLAPITARATIVNDQTLADAGAFGVQKAEYGTDATGKVIITKNGLKHREEFGGYLKMQFQQKVMDNVNFQTMLELFSNYLVKPGNIDVNWTTLTSMKVNKYISATFSTQLMYDDDIAILRNTGSKKGTFGPDLQFKQVLAIGMTYKF
jgi:hypothetical protein